MSNGGAGQKIGIERARDRGTNRIREGLESSQGKMGHKTQEGEEGEKKEKKKKGGGGKEKEKGGEKERQGEGADGRRVTRGQVNITRRGIYGTVLVGKAEMRNQSGFQKQEEGGNWESGHTKRVSGERQEGVATRVVVTGKGGKKVQGSEGKKG